jgi:enamine deaminase RidA (YjgF/YER057c/UK114 family)
MPKLDHLRPSGLHHNPAYSHVVTAVGARGIYISGQVSVDEEGRIVGEGDLAAQTTQVMQNLGLALKAAGATYANIVKITTCAPSSARPARPSSKAWSRQPAPSSVSLRSQHPNG